MNAGKPDVYTYDEIPERLRIQIIHLWREAFGRYDPFSVNDAGEAWARLHDEIAREKGVFELGTSGEVEHRCEQHFQTCSVEDALDMIEHAFSGIIIASQHLIAELNARFRENAVGYQFSNGTILRVDSQYIHSEVVRPALALLSGAFAAANEEFLTAHRHYREGSYKDCIVSANRSFETVLKTICRARGWAFNQGDRASELVTRVRNEGLFPSYLGKGLDTYIALLKTGLPGVRNSAGGHGDDPAAPPVPSYIAAHALHLTAANIVLLVEAFNEL